MPRRSRFPAKTNSIALGALTLNDGSTLSPGGQAVAVAGLVTLNDGWIAAGSISATPRRRLFRPRS